MPITKQVFIAVEIGGYEDEVTCDVVPMSASHLLFGRPWQYDRKAKHDGETNEYLVTHKGKEYLLKPLTPQDAAIDQSNLQLDMKRHQDLMERRSKKPKKVYEDDEPTTPEGYYLGECSEEEDNKHMVLHIELSNKCKAVSLSDSPTSFKLQYPMVREGKSTTPMRFEFYSNLFISYLCRNYEEFSWPRRFERNALFHNEVTLFHNLHSLKLKLHVFGNGDDDQNTNDYACIFRIKSPMLEKNMLECCDHGFHLLYHFIVLFPFDVGVDLRTNPSEGGGDDEDIPRGHTYKGGGAHGKIQLPSGPSTRPRKKQFQQSLLAFFKEQTGSTSPPPPKEVHSYINLVTWSPFGSTLEAHKHQEPPRAENTLYGRF